MSTTSVPQRRLCSARAGTSFLRSTASIMSLLLAKGSSSDQSAAGLPYNRTPLHWARRNPPGKDLLQDPCPVCMSRLRVAVHGNQIQRCCSSRCPASPCKPYQFFSFIFLYGLHQSRITEMKQVSSFQEFPRNILRMGPVIGSRIVEEEPVYAGIARTTE